MHAQVQREAFGYVYVAKSPPRLIAYPLLGARRIECDAECRLQRVHLAMRAQLLIDPFGNGRSKDGHGEGQSVCVFALLNRNGSDGMQHGRRSCSRVRFLDW